MERKKEKRQLSPRIVAFFQGRALLFVGLAVVAACGLDVDYLLFVDPDPPHEFSVDVADIGVVSVCGGSNDVTVSVTALKMDGTTDTRYRRAVKLLLVDTDDQAYSFTPTKTPHFTEGSVTLTDIALPPVPSGTYSLRCVDERDREITGTSDSFLLEVLYVDHLDVSGLPPIIFSGSSYVLTVRAVDQHGSDFVGFDAYVDMNITEGYSISPASLKLHAGSGYGSFRISGSGPLVISATLSADQRGELPCTGGLEIGAGDSSGGDGSTDGGGGAGGGGGGGGAGGGGDGGGGDEGGESAEPTNLDCTLTGPTTDILVTTDFSMYLTVAKTDQNGGSFPSFSAGVSFSPTDIGLDPLSSTVSSFGTNYKFSITTAGSHTITATVTDNDSALPPCSCSADVRVVDGIGVYGDHAAALIGKLESRLPDKKFFEVNSISSIESIAPYSAFIVSLAGSGYAISRGNLTASQAAVIKAYYDSGSPILISHDNISVSASSALVTPVWGVSEIIEIDFRIEQNPFIHESSSPVHNDERPEYLQEVFIDGFAYSETIGTPVVTMEYSDSTYALILSQTTGTKAVLMGEAIWHPFGGDENKETQWWDGAVNQNIVVSLITWMLLP